MLAILVYSSIQWCWVRWVTVFRLSFVLSLHWLWSIWRTLLTELEALAEIGSFEMMFINSSGGSENGFSKFLNASINLIQLVKTPFRMILYLKDGLRDRLTDNFGYIWFRQCPFQQCTFFVHDANSPTVNLDGHVVLFIGLINPHGRKNTTVFLTVKLPWSSASFMESNEHFMSFKNTNPLLR